MEERGLERRKDSVSKRSLDFRSPSPSLSRVGWVRARERERARARERERERERGSRRVLSPRTLSPRSPPLALSSASSRRGRRDIDAPASRKGERDKGGPDIAGADPPSDSYQKAERRAREIEREHAPTATTEKKNSEPKNTQNAPPVLV